MEHPVKAPAVGESITEVRILKWKKSDGEAVNPGDILVEIETDKATVEVASETKGALQIIAKEGETVTIGALIAKVDDSKAGTAGAATSAVKSPTPSASAAIPASAGNLTHSAPLSPAVRRMAEESGVDISKMSPGEGKAGRLTKGDLLREISTRGSGGKSSSESGQKILQSIGESLGVLQPQSDRPGDRRVAMSRLRLKIAERLVQAQHTAAILTTFNEVDMNPVQVMRNKNKEAFKAKHGVALSFMSFFTKASQIALKAIPEINASIQGKDIVYHDYYDIGIAVGTERGLVVPVLRGVEKMGFVDIEKGIGVLAAKARDNKLTLSDMDGGTFTISNGGTYGSLMSTPILNPPQSGILGMHKIMDRPVAIDGKVEIRPMMYIALSYDHRIVDGKGAVTFLVTLKDLLEHPEKLGFDF